MKKRFFALLAVVLTLCASVGTVAADNDSDKVNVSFDKMEYDFGVITQKSEPITHEFVITNNGSQPLVIFSAYLSSPQLELPLKEEIVNIEFNKKPIAPGESTYIKVSFDSSKWNGEWFHGTITLRLKSVSGKLKRVMLKFRVKVKQ